MMQEKISENKRNTFVIMIVFVGLIAGISWLLVRFFGANSLLFYGIMGFAAVYAFIQYWFADKLALMMSGAKQITQDENPRLWNTVATIVQRANMPMPRVYIMNDPAPNAFATGRDPKHAAVAATTGILEVMDDRELTAVFAHEMSHVKNYDIRVTMIAFGLTSIISMLADVLLRMMIFGDDEDNGVFGVVISVVLMVVAPLMAMLIQMAISRQREYLADATGSELVNDPEGLARALEKLRDYSQPMKRQSMSTAHLFISNPLSKGAVTKLFSTHPPLDERIARLRGGFRDER